MSRRIQLSLQSWSWILTAAVFLLFFLAGMSTRWITGSAPSSVSDNASQAATGRDREPADDPSTPRDGNALAPQSSPEQRDRFADCALANFYATHPDLAMKVPPVLEAVLRIKLANLTQSRIEAGDHAVASRLASCLQPGQRVASAAAAE